MKVTALQSNQIFRIFTADPAINWIRYYRLFLRKITSFHCTKGSGFKRKNISINNNGRENQKLLETISYRLKRNKNLKWREGGVKTGMWLVQECARPPPGSAYITTPA
jgi:hypothetical protein